MNAFGYVKIALVKNSRTYYLDIPLGATWQDCIDATLEFVPQIETMRDNAAQQVQQAQQQESAEQQPQEAA